MFFKLYRAFRAEPETNPVSFIVESNRGLNAELIIQLNPENSNLQGKSNKVRSIGRKMTCIEDRVIRI